MRRVRSVSSVEQVARGEMDIEAVEYLVKDCPASKRLHCFLFAHKATLIQPLYGIACVQKSSCVLLSIWSLTTITGLT